MTTLFSEAEMRRRRAAFGAVLERGGVSHALVYGANRSGSAVSWLTGWPVTREALLVAGMAENDDVLLVGFFNHVPQARRLSRVRVEWAGSRASRSHRGVRKRIRAAHLGPCGERARGP